MKKISILLLFCFLLIGCMTPYSTQRTTLLSLGMTKAEVIKVMGRPQSVKAKDTIEVLEYILWLNQWTGERQQYWVMLENGKVVQYGVAGDFGSALPKDRREYNINVRDK